MKPTPLRAAITERGHALGVFVMLDGGGSARLLSRMGFDFLIFDLQHAGFDLTAIETVLGASRGTECSPLARVRPNRPDQIEWVLDLGAHGVVVPMVGSAADARVAVDACRYPPRGRRSVGAIRNILERGEDFMSQANDDVLCIIQIEHVDAVERIDEILDVGGIDAVLPGHVDLALSMGHQLSYGSTISNTVPTAVADAIATVEESCASRSIPVIPVTATDDEVRMAAATGHRIICCNTDFHLLRESAAQLLHACRAVMDSNRCA